MNIGARPLHRVKGRPALTRRLRGLLIAVHRFSRARATTDADRRWTARMLDALTAALAVADVTANHSEAQRHAAAATTGHARHETRGSGWR